MNITDFYQVEKRLDIGKLNEKIYQIPPEEKVKILWDIVSLYKNEPEITTEDLLFFKRIAFRLNIDKSLIELMLR